MKTLTVSDFEVILMGPVYTPGNVPTGPSPVIASFVANPSTIHAGETSTLSWTVSNVSYTIVSPGVGPSRETSAVVQPTATTTYKIYATNQYGRKTRSVTVTVN